MQKPAIVMITAAALIVSGLVLLVAGSQIVLEGVGQENGMASSGMPLVVQADFDAGVLTGVFAVQIMEFRDGVFSAAILNPSGVETDTYQIDAEGFERKFDVADAGTYKLIVQSDDDAETHVFGAIGPLPDAGKRSLGFVSVYVLVAGMIGLVGVGIYGIKKRRSV